MDLSYFHEKFHPKRASRFLQTSTSVLGGLYYLQVPYDASCINATVLLQVYLF